MATKTEQAVQAVNNDVIVLKEHVAALRSEVEPIPALAERMAVIEHQLAEMTKTKELWGQRGWMILTICLSAGFSFLAVILGALFTYYLSAKK